MDNVETKTDWATLEKQYLMINIKRPELVAVKGKGATLWDDEGRAYLDFMGGWAVNVLGHCPEVLVKALTEQAQTLIHTSNQYYTIPQIKLAQALVENSVFDKVFFSNSGAEANEGAVKLARKYGKGAKNGAYGVITTLKSFHGRTLAMVAATGKPQYQTAYTPLPAGFVNVPYNDLEAIKAATDEKTVAVMLELIQGEGGVNVATPEYVKGLREWCDANNMLLIVDEVQTGIARTGTLFCYEQYNITPDIMTLAKGLGGGVTIGAVMARGKAVVWEPGDHGSTFGGNPLATASALAVFNEVLRLNLSEQAKTLGQQLVDGLNALAAKHPVIKETRGKGLLIATEFTSEIANDIVAAALQKGLLLNAPSATTLRFMPPLTITPAQVDEALAILDELIP